ncbi:MULTISPECIES: holin family protein [Bacillus subtilis group]|uniref:phage holin family protein n=1 Tax=Bacillus subtilis group TaxID=653685 RepID=UPI0022831903|nr:phage holin family protein [Bacillus inaquosorum]MCY8796271.1 phage holin family protein [Bacillus inaquosorum]MEC0772021.1 phage holin family protein [Bacillus inaquosorum]MEC0797390.1 phage holin family protein [Bacillus inaquosorum]
MSYLSNFYVWMVGLIGSLTEFVSGHYNNAVFILVAMMLLDVITGLLKGAKNKRLKSAIMHMGIIKKAGMLLAIVFASLLDILVNDGMPVFRTLMTWLAIGNEGLSIIENFTALGVKIPTQIKDKLAQVVSEKEELQSEKDKAES